MQRNKFSPLNVFELMM